MKKYQRSDLSERHQEILASLTLMGSFTLDELNSHVIQYCQDNHPTNNSQMQLQHLQEMRTLRRREQLSQAAQTVTPTSWLVSIFETVKMGLLGSGEPMPYEFLGLTFYGVGREFPNDPSRPNTFKDVTWKEISIVGAIFLMGAIRATVGQLRTNKAKNSAKLKMLNLLLTTLEEAFDAQARLFKKRAEILLSLNVDASIGPADKAEEEGASEIGHDSNFEQLEVLYNDYQRAYEAVNTMLGECQTLMPELQAVKDGNYLQIDPQTLQTQIKAIQAGKKNPNSWRSYFYDCYETFVESVGASGLWMLVTTINPSYLWQDVPTLEEPYSSLWLYGIGYTGTVALFAYQMSRFSSKRAQTSAQDQATVDFIEGINVKLNQLSRLQLQQLDVGQLAVNGLTTEQQQWLGVSNADGAVQQATDSKRDVLSSFRDGLFPPRTAVDSETQSLLFETDRGLADGGVGVQIV